MFKIRESFLNLFSLLPALLIFILLFGFQNKGIGQLGSTYAVFDKETQTAIPFVSVTYYTADRWGAIISDKDGKFTLKNADVDSIKITSTGYSQLIIRKPISYRIYMEKKATLLDEVIVGNMENPAIRIIKMVLKNKPQNNFEERDYQYNSYSKIKTAIRVERLPKVQDSVFEKVKRKLQNQISFITESYFLFQKKANHGINTLLASKTTGMKSPLMSQIFVNAFHSAIPIYNDDIYLFESTDPNEKLSLGYLSPVAANCIQKYRYHLNDELINGEDTTFIISFEPDKGKNFKGFKGLLYITSNGYAITDVIADPADNSFINLKFRQQFSHQQGKWFPHTLAAELTMGRFAAEKGVYAIPAYSFVSTLSRVQFNPIIGSKALSYESSLINTDSISHSTAILIRERSDTLSKDEQLSYKQIDSVADKMPYLEKAFLALPKLSKGLLPIGKVDIDFTPLGISNDYEGSRIGMGLYTNEKLFRNIDVGGYVGYGTRDKSYKYGGSLSYYFDRGNDFKIQAAYDDNLFETGILTYSQLRRNTIDEYFRSYIASRFDRRQQISTAIGKKLGSTLYAEVSLYAKKMLPKFSYSFKQAPATVFYNDEVSLYLRLAKNERVMDFAGQKMSTQTANPLFEFTYKSGIPLVHSTSLRYNKFLLSGIWSFFKSSIGSTTAQINLGIVDRPLPYSFLFTGQGIMNKRISVYMDGSFQTLYPYEFLSDRYVHVFLTHDFGNLLFKPKSNLIHPKIFLANNWGIGNLKNGVNSGITYSINNHVYAETGILLRQIVRKKFLGMGYAGIDVGIFRRYGFYTLPVEKDNWAFKYGVSFSFD